MKTKKFSQFPLKPLFFGLSFMLLTACQENDQDHLPLPTASTDAEAPLPTLTPTPLNTNPVRSDVFIKHKPESLIECINYADLDQNCRLIQPSIVLEANPNHEMRTYQVDYEMTCGRGKSEHTEIYVRAQSQADGNVGGLVSSATSARLIIQGNDDLRIENSQPKVLAFRSYSTGCYLTVNFQQI
ncbi:MAG: hypothetical protein H7318_08495 [Oligoflexus sp.]|nr:hypothetical protein [Oligoflexus sp.]